MATDFYEDEDGRLNAFGTPRENITNAVPVINSDHEAIHLSYGFSASVYSASVANAATLLLEFRTPTSASGKYVHLKKYKPWGEGGLNQLEIVEAPTLTTGVTAITPQNRNRVETPVASVSTLKSNPTTISGGTIIDGPIAFGGGGVGAGQGGNDDNDNEIILKPDTTYLFRLTNNSGAAKALGLWIFWYEES